MKNRTVAKASHEAEIEKLKGVKEELVSKR